MERYPRGIMASCVLPWDEKWQFMEDLFREEVRLVVSETPLVYIMGTAGEGYAVSREQFSHIVKVFAEEMRRSGAEPMIGLISLSTAEINARIEECRRMGIRDFQISLPAWSALSEDETLDFFDFICGNNTDCRFLHYNILRSKRIVDPLEYRKIEKRNPNLVATKITTDSIRYLGKLFEYTEELRHFVSDLNLPYASLLADVGLLIAMGTCNWQTAQRYFDASSSGNFAAALELQRSLLRLNTDLRDLVLTHGSIDGAFDKMYVKLYQPEFPLRLYPPYHYVPDSTFKEFKKLLAEEYPEWAPA